MAISARQAASAAGCAGAARWRRAALSSIAAGALVTVLIGTPALAQSAPGPVVPGQEAAAPQTTAPAAPTETTAPDTTGEPNDIIVTARRRSENIERVPTSVTAFGAQQLAERTIKSETDLQLTVPGLTLRQTEGSNELTFSIRGQTREANTGSPIAVVPYVDEVQFNNGGGSTFYDLDSIQVLKGPQGTLFGRNATGGAVLYTTARPTDQFEGYLKGRFGNLGLKEGEGAINIPLAGDKAMLRVAFDAEHRDGYVHNLYDDSYLGVVDRQSGRVSLTLKPFERLTNSTVFQYGHSGGNSTGASYLFSVNPCGATNNGVTLACPSAGLYNPAAFDAVFGPGAWEAYRAAHRDIPEGGLLDYEKLAHERGAWVTDSQVRSRHRETDWYVANTTSYDLGGGAVLKNIFGASRARALDDVIETGEPFGVEFTENFARNQYGNIVTTKQLSDELQLQGKSGNLTYIAGAYYQRSSTHQFSPQAYFDLRPFAITNATADYILHDQTEAAYAQGTYDLGSMMRGLSFTAGVRYTWEQVNVDHLPGDTFYPAKQQRSHFSDPSWDVGFEYQATPALLAYLKTRGSFRSGGLNGFAPPIPTGAGGGGDQFDSEHIRDVEGGLKYGGRLFGRPAHFNAALYYDWVTGIQRVQFPIVNGASIAVTVNAPAAEVYGAEADGALSLAPWLEVGASGAYTHATYTDGHVVLFGVNYLYGPYADTPRWSGTVFGRLLLPVPEHVGEMSLRVDVYGQTAQYFSNAAATVTPGTKLPGYTLLNGRFDWNDIARTKLSAGFFAKNITNKAYFTGGLPQGESLGLNGAAVGEPRTFGVEVSYKF